MDLKTQRSSFGQDYRIRYDTYHLTVRQWIFYGGTGILIAAMIDIVFYRDLFFFFLLMPLGMCFPVMMKKRLCQKRKDQLGSQFKDAILALASALQAGYSAENAWREAWKEMICVYGENGLITQELEYMVRALTVNETAEELILQLAERSGLPEIDSFAQVFCLAKRSSGDLVSIINSTAHTISEKLRVREEIVTLTTAKQLEETIMIFIPIGIILYLNVSFDGLLDVLYQGIFGRTVMTVCLAIYGAAVIAGAYIVSPARWE